MASYPGRTARPLASDCHERLWHPGCRNSESFSEGPSWATGARPSLQLKAPSAGIAMGLPYAPLPVEEEDGLRWVFRRRAVSGNCLSIPRGAPAPDRAPETGREACRDG